MTTTFTAVHDWGDITVVSPSVTFWPQPSGAPIDGQIIAGVLCDMTGNPGVVLSTATGYVVRFEGVSVGGRDGNIPTFPMGPGVASSTVNLGNVFPNIAATRPFGAPTAIYSAAGVIDNHDGTATGYGGVGM